METSIDGLNMKAAMTMTVPALKGVMGNTDYYVITMPFSVAAEYLTTTDRNLDVKLRENRKVSPQRFAEIAEYIWRNPDDYRFSAITCTFGKDQTKEPVKWTAAPQYPFIGILELDQTSPFIIVDGQHRFGAIQKVLEDHPEFGDERISVVLFPYISIKKAQQLFSDLNRTAKKTTKSLDILFDYRDIANRVVQKLVDSVPVFKGRINLEDASVPRHSEQLFTIAALYQATKPIIEAIPETGLITEELGGTLDIPLDNEQEYTEILTGVWEFLSKQFPEWQRVASGTSKISEIRTDYLHWNSGVISTVGDFVAEAMRQFGKDWQPAVAKALTHPMTHNWRRDADEWQGIITAATQVMPRSLVRPSLKAFLKKLGDLELNDADKRQLEAVNKMKGELKVPAISI